MDMSQSKLRVDFPGIKRKKYIILKYENNSESNDYILIIS